MPTPVKLDTAVLDPDRVSLLIGGRVDVAPTGGGRSRLQGALISLGEARIDGAVDLRHDRALLERLMPLPGALLMVPGSWFDPPRR